MRGRWSEWQCAGILCQSILPRKKKHFNLYYPQKSKKIIKIAEEETVSAFSHLVLTFHALIGYFSVELFCFCKIVFFILKKVFFILKKDILHNFYLV